MLIFDLIIFPIWIGRTFKAGMKRYTDEGSLCLVPLSSLKCFVELLLLITPLSTLQKSVITHPINCGRNRNESRTVKGRNKLLNQIPFQNQLKIKLLPNTFGVVNTRKSC